MIERILNIVTIIMFLVTLVILGMFIFGGEVPNQIYDTPVHTDTLINWAYILFGLAIFFAIIFPMVRLVTRPKEAMKSFFGLAIIAVIVFIAYAMADATPMSLVGYNGPDNIPSMLILSDTIIFTMYLLFGGAIFAIFTTEIYRRVK